MTVALSARDLRTVAGLKHELASVSAGRPAPFEALLPELQQLLRSENVVLLKMREAPVGWDIDLFHWSGPSDVAKTRELVVRFFRDAPSRFAWYNAGNPEPAQRNRVIEALGRIPQGEYESSRIRSDLLVPLGIERHKQLRCLVCDGPALLAWFGAFIPERVDERQFELLRRLVAPLRRRLTVEERLREGPQLRAALEAALEHVAAPAFVLGELGNIREANAAGRALLDGSSRSETVTALRDAALGRTRRPAYELTSLRDGDRRIGWLAIARSNEPGPASRRRLTATRHAERWRLSPRQAQVLALLIDGASNLRISCELGISERTVEDHVSAILTKAQVGTRAELIAEMIG